MAKYIDADALIMHLSDYALTESPNDTNSMKDRLIHETAYNAINECIKAVEEMPAADVEPVRRWIPCSGRLPEISCYVLAYYENMSEIPEVLHYNSFPGHEGFYYDETIMSGVTHWMPLPEPPKMGGGSE